jgi:tetratricopeptide (TPR) repeat protein
VIEGGQNIYLDNALSRAARIAYFEKKDYAKAEEYFAKLKEETANAELKLDAMRGLIRAQYEQKKWKEAVPNAQDLLKERGASQDDKVLSYMVLARSLQEGAGYAEAISAYRNVLPINKAMYAAEARYRIAECYYLQNDWKNAEKSALETIKTSGSYDSWITRSYILLGDISWKQKDYFNAKATFTSVVDNTKDSELKKEAEIKLQQVIEEEKKAGKIDQ